ncbi:15109_t:CDS:2 [Entrophospora sp. SA101]|nr:15109_t:CDS:2 [Entrophospora sp. SA101]
MSRACRTMVVEEFLVAKKDHLNNKNVSINLPRRFGINSNNSELNDNKDDERK